MVINYYSYYAKGLDPTSIPRQSFAGTVSRDLTWTQTWNDEDEDEDEEMPRVFRWRDEEE